MKLFSANIEDLKTLYITNLRKALDLEQKIVKNLPLMIENSTDQQLANGLRVHLEQSQGHASKVASLLEQHTGSDSSETCKAMDGLATEGSDVMKDAADPIIRDISIIAAAQQIEHHEIAVYGTLKNWARVLGLSSDVATLESIEKDEILTDQKLTQIASTVNYQAQTEPAMA